MKNKDKILELINKRGKITSREITKPLKVSRQYANQVISELAKEGKVCKIGGTRGAFYISKTYMTEHPETISMTFRKRYVNRSLEEHTVLIEIEDKLPQIGKLPENIRSIFTFAFSEMLNNAIEHSKSKIISVEVTILDKSLSFVVNDAGVGVFRNIMKKRNLKSTMEAIQDLLKGKTTTMPKTHSGEGIFFTSKVGDTFTLDSFGQTLEMNNVIHDVAVRKTSVIKRGTSVTFRMGTDSKRHLNDIFKKYTNLNKDSDYGFDKTEIRVKLFASSGIHISRSQARRILAGLDKFKIVILDYKNVPIVGQAFADEIYRVFHNSHPEIVIQDENMSEGVKFMVKRAKNASPPSKTK